MTFEIALTGINAASAELEVIANNIANNATNGFKRSRANFADVYSSTSNGTSNVTSGSGVRIAGINQEFKQGDVTYTNNNMDLSIGGEGFFRLENNGVIEYSRAGTFGLDNEGYIVNSGGGFLTGYEANSDGKITSALGRINVGSDNLPPKQTSTLSLSLNLDTASEVPVAYDRDDPSSYNFSTSTTIFDSQGTAHEMSMFYRKDAANEWTSYTYVGDTEVSQPGGEHLVFDTQGKIASLNGVAIADSNTVNTIQFTPLDGTEPQEITISLGAMTQYDIPFGVNEVLQNGFSTGRLSDIEIDSSGIVYGRYSNNSSKALGQIVISNFTNPQGLSPTGGTTWTESFSSGVAATGIPGSASLGLVQSGTLEESNVDITEELVAMIGAQRSFQANAQVISTSDTLTQTIINLR